MRYSTLLFVTVFHSACSNNSKLANFSRLEGEWIYSNGDELFSESWKTVNDSLMVGTSFMTLKGDTVFKEDLQLTSSNGVVYYIPTVPDQNNGAAVRFKLLKSTKDQWIFENKQHDFPSQIIYGFKGSDSLIATVQGIQNGRSQKIEFRLKKK